MSMLTAKNHIVHPYGREVYRIFKNQKQDKNNSTTKVASKFIFVNNQHKDILFCKLLTMKVTTISPINDTSMTLFPSIGCHF